MLHYVLFRERCSPLTQELLAVKLSPNTKQLKLDLILSRKQTILIVTSVVSSDLFLLDQFVVGDGMKFVFSEFLEMVYARLPSKN